MFSKADQVQDVAEKKRILQQITSTPSVSPEQRKNAADMLQGLAGPEPTTPTNPTGGAGTYVPPNPNYGGSSGGATATTTTAKTSDPPAGQTAPPPPGQFDEAAIRRSIEGKVWSGKASEHEIRTLIAICKHQQDVACKTRAQAMLKKAQGG